MKIITITLPVKDWEESVLSFREREKRKWQRKLEARKKGKE